MFYDSHLHNIKSEEKGFLVGLEGVPSFDNVLSNNEVLSMSNEKYISFYYIQKSEVFSKVFHKYLKYHPRRENYEPQMVIENIKKNKPKCVMIDTLNEPNWVAYDYWKIAKAFPEIIFIFTHAGGYLVNEFIKICHFQTNVWLDFSLTHTVLGQYGQGLSYIDDAIKFALKGPFKDRILLGSDYPFFSQQEVYEYYNKLGVIELLNANFVSLKELIV